MSFKLVEMTYEMNETISLHLSINRIIFFNKFLN